MNNTTKIALILILGIALITLIKITFFPTEYKTPEKYKKNMFSGGKQNTMTKEKQEFAQRRRVDQNVRILDDETASLGDFTFNAGTGRTKIVANIALKFEDAKSGWFNSGDAKEEILKRGTLLRNAVIDTMMENQGTRVNDENIKNKLLDNINSYLSDAVATEIYFNQFIVQY